jgi:hypothetical protein
MFTERWKGDGTKMVVEKPDDHLHTREAAATCSAVMTSLFPASAIFHGFAQPYEKQG